MKSPLLKLAACVWAIMLSTTIFSQWQPVGSAGFTSGDAFFTSLTFSPTGEPYVAYEDIANSLKATVMKFDRTNWVTIGTQGFSAGEANYTSLAFNSSGEPYVAFRDWGNGAKITV